MDHTPDRIEREIFIQASPRTVWQVITEPEHVRRWFGDEASFVAEAGSEGTVAWREHGAYPIRIELVDAERRFVFRWIRRSGVTLEQGSTLVEFMLTAEEGGTRLRVVESGFAMLPWAAAERTEHADENSIGWRRELDELAEYVADLVGGHPRP